MAGFTPKLKKVTKANSRDRLKLAGTLFREKRYDEALEEATAILEEEPSSLQALMLTGSVYLKTKRFDEALDAFQKALRVDPLSPQACLGIGMAHLRKKDYKQATVAFESALKLDPKSAKAYITLGMSALGQEHYDLAIQYFNKALRFDPQAEMARILISRAYKKLGKPGDAVSTLETAVKLNPKSGMANMSLASFYLQNKDYTSAEAALQRVLEARGDKPAPTIMLSLADLYVQTDRTEEAGDILRALPSAPKLQARKHKLFGDLYTKQGLLKEAAEEYRAASLMASDDDEIDDVDLDGLVEAGSASWQELASTYRATATESISRK
ncbi:MAG: tetratricopeptide repeat protein [Aphanocapsa lilacina HA4352-LM1]|jgi:tetratricopeptide (TPR) repeat protein|uniref:Glr1902 protein n=1 Tax=Gloeobacter violaceus (strain ATCC 29082 / PCC 7421) TaxID=251221 RepID=Q7NJD0_GLOVI|nr:tetratricopeptide repeat protein [Gloeobacter violaceus]MBW4696655.1 tetratricopeptide repeat protein [Aphanocapsa lilacina HA4352-LM1]BAC89843.1 glr1902 [Gloeobacter violaceus PCC 7421]